MKTLILADIHGNWPALRAVLAVESNVDQILCLGDLVNYGPLPVECVAWAMQLLPPNRIIQGNHDRAFGLNRSVCAPMNRWFAEDIQTATNHLLTAEMKAFLAALQPAQEFSQGATKCVALHAALTEWSFSYQDQVNPKWPWESDIILRGHPDKLLLFAGHPDLLLLAGSHAAFKAQWGTTLTVNPGSVGWPTDGDSRAAYAIWDDTGVTLRRVPYNIEETVQAFARLELNHELTEGIAAALRAGGQTISQ